MKKRDEDKDKFIAILAHDLISPFNTILGFMNILIEKLPDYSEYEINRQLQFIKESAQNTYHLLEDILLWVKSQDGNLFFEPQPILLREFCFEVISSVYDRAEYKNISVECTVPQTLTVFADVNMLKIVLRNLITNAIKFTHRGGYIKVEAEMNEKNTIVSVSDNGIGIEENIQEILWDNSQQYSTKGTANEKGTGLGLALCKQFIVRHNGSIWVESEKGKGCNFRFSIPVK